MEKNIEFNEKEFPFAKDFLFSHGQSKTFPKIYNFGTLKWSIGPLHVVKTN